MLSPAGLESGSILYHQPRGRACVPGAIQREIREAGGMGQPCLVGPGGAKELSGCWESSGSSADPRTSARVASRLQVWWGPRCRERGVEPGARAAALGFPSRAQPTALGQGTGPGFASDFISWTQLWVHPLVEMNLGVAR